MRLLSSDVYDHRFLWASLQILEICEAVTDNDIRQALADLPEDLAETFSRILRRVAGSRGGSRKIATAESVFKWLLGARRLLTLNELREAAALSECASALDPNLMPSVEKLVHSCGNLIRIDSETQAVAFAHPTVVQYLSSQANSADSYPALHFPQSDTEHYLAEMCLKYLTLPNFVQIVAKPSRLRLDSEVLENTLVPDTALARSAARILRHSQKPVLDPQTRVSIDPLQISGVSIDQRRAQGSRFELLDYVVSFWCEHTKTWDLSEPSWQEFQKLTLEHQMPVKFRPWSEHSRSDEYLYNVLQWAIDYDNPALLRVVASRVELRADDPSDLISPDMGHTGQGLGYRWVSTC